MKNFLTQGNGGEAGWGGSGSVPPCHDDHWHREDLMNTSVAIPEHMPKLQHYLITPWGLFLLRVIDFICREKIPSTSKVDVVIWQEILMSWF